MPTDFFPYFFAEKDGKKWVPHGDLKHVYTMLQLISL